MSPSRPPALLKVPAAPAASGRCRAGWGSARPAARPPCACTPSCSEETSQEPSARRAVPGHWQGDKAQPAVEAQLLLVSGTDLAKHSPRPWKGGERSGPGTRTPVLGLAPAAGTPSPRGAASPQPFGTGCLSNALRHGSVCPGGHAGASLSQGRDREPRGGLRGGVRVGLAPGSAVGRGAGRTGPCRMKGTPGPRLGGRAHRWP